MSAKDVVILCVVAPLVLVLPLVEVVILRRLNGPADRFMDWLDRLIGGGGE